MKNRTNIKLPLTDIEKANLRKNKIKIANILDFATDELEVLLNATTDRAKEIYALAEFQTVHLTSTGAPVFSGAGFCKAWIVRQ